MFMAHYSRWILMLYVKFLLYFMFWLPWDAFIAGSFSLQKEDEVQEVFWCNIKSQFCLNYQAEKCGMQLNV